MRRLFVAALLWTAAVAAALPTAPRPIAANANITAAVSRQQSFGESSSQWHSYASPPTPNALACGVVVENDGIALGGITSGDVLSSAATVSKALLSVDLISKWWTTAYDIPFGVRGHTACAIHHDTLIISPAGQDSSAEAPASSAVYFTNPHTKESWPGPNMTFPRRRACIASQHDAVYVVGGVCPLGHPVEHVERFQNGRWESVAKVPRPLCDCSYASHADGLFVLCADCNATAPGSQPAARHIVALLRLGNMTFETLPVPVWPALLDGQLSVAGASIAQYAIFVVVTKSNPRQPLLGYWDVYLRQLHYVVAPPLDTPRAHGTPFITRSSLVFIGGQTISPTTAEYGSLTAASSQVQVMPEVTANVGRENHIYTVGESVEISCAEGNYTMLAQTARCQVPTAGTSPTRCRAGKTLLPLTSAAPTSFVCVSLGTCATPTSRRVACPVAGAAESFFSCNAAGCCFDMSIGPTGSVKDRCFRYREARVGEELFFINALLSPVIVQPITHSWWYNFVHSTRMNAAAGAVAVLFVAVVIGCCTMCCLRCRKDRSHGDAAADHDARLVNGKYIVVRKLGQGGFGQVFLVHLKDVPARRYALKFIPCESDEDRSCAMKEFELIQQAQGHPHMVSIHDMFMNWASAEFGSSGDSILSSPIDTIAAATVRHEREERKTQPRSLQAEPAEPLLGEAPRFVCIVLTFVEGGDLARYIVAEHRAGRVPLAEDWLLDVIATQLCDVLAYLHGRQQPIIHRDLKPENVLLSDDRQTLYVTDFGLARQQEQQDAYITTRAGSLQYVAPECWAKRYTAAVDMWGVGCILYAAATGRVTARTARVMFHDAREPNFEASIRTDLKAYSPRFVDLVLDLLQTDPHKRLTAQQALVRLRATSGASSEQMQFFPPHDGQEVIHGASEQRPRVAADVA